MEQHKCQERIKPQNTTGKHGNQSYPNSGPLPVTFNHAANRKSKNEIKKLNGEYA